MADMVGGIEPRVGAASRHGPGHRPPAPTVNRNGRRGAVVAAYGGYAAAVTLLWLGYGLDRVPLFAAAAVPGAVALVGLGGLVSDAVGIFRLANEPDDRLDEREQRVRDQAFGRAYGILAVVGLVGLAYLQLADHGGRWTPASTDALAILSAGWLLLAATLPTAILAWTEPDPEPETEPDADPGSRLPAASGGGRS